MDEWMDKTQRKQFRAFDGEDGGQEETVAAEDH